MSAYFEPNLYMLKLHCLIQELCDSWESARVLIKRLQVGPLIGHGVTVKEIA